MTERLYYNKYEKNNPIREISKQDFYTNLKTVSKTTLSKICVYLTNGANDRVGYQDGDGGTTLGFNSIKQQTENKVNLFDNNNFTVIFDSTTTVGPDTELSGIINAENQVANTKVGDKDTKISAGSVIKVTTVGTDEFPVCGGYHIKGIQWKIISQDKERKEQSSVALVQAYYTAILDDFIKDVSDTNTFYILHLAQIPGGLFGGTQITGNAMHEAVNEWLKARSIEKQNFMISIDFNNPTSISPGSTSSSIPGHASSSTPGPASSSTSSYSPALRDIDNLQKSLQEKIDMVDASKKNHPIFKSIDDIYKNFFSKGGTRTKESLIQSIDRLLLHLNGAHANNRQQLSTIRDSLSLSIKPSSLPELSTTPNQVVSAELTASKYSTSNTNETKYVFAFDVDDTLVLHGSLYAAEFNPAADAPNHDEMLQLMKDIIGVGHYVWIVTASNKITKENFEKNYLKNDTDIKNSKNYYFMNPAEVTKELSTIFKPETLSTLLTKPVVLGELTYTNDTSFQTKGLKPYAMLAKWNHLGLKPDNVKMYLFDDNESAYKDKCENCKGKVDFVKITPGDSAAVSKFGTDVLKKATEKFEEVKKAASIPVSTGGGKLKVMTFNTWFEAFNPKPKGKGTKGDTEYCNDKDSGKNKCTDTIMKTIVDRMKQGGPQVIFLQEFTSRGDEFFKKAGVTITTSEIIKSSTNVQTTGASGGKTDTKIPQFRHFTMKVDGKQFYVYTATIVQETITTIYSSELHDGSADAFFIGNTAIVRKNPHDNSPYFWKDNTEKADETNIWIFGGARPYIVLEFNSRKLVLINLHSHHSKEPFRPKENEAFDDDQATFVNSFKQPGGASNSVQTYGFSVLGNMLKESSRIPNLSEYNIVIGGDFNAPPDRTLDLLNLSLGTDARSFTDNGIERAKLGNTCCTTTDADTFHEVVDQIYSRGLQIVKGSYRVYNAKTLEMGKDKKTQNYFSDHLPVYAEIELPPPHT
jgi:hypothetical protein